MESMRQDAGRLSRANNSQIILGPIPKAVSVPNSAARFLKEITYFPRIGSTWPT